MTDVLSIKDIETIDKIRNDPNLRSTKLERFRVFLVYGLAKFLRTEIQFIGYTKKGDEWGARWKDSSGD